MFTCVKVPGRSLPLAEKAVSLNALDLAVTITALALVTLGLLAYHQIPPFSSPLWMYGTFGGAGVLALGEIFYKCVAGAKLLARPEPQKASDSAPLIPRALEHKILVPKEKTDTEGVTLKASKEAFLKLEMNPDGLPTTRYNRQKDRYTNVLPYTHNLFKYTTEGYAEEGYINASALPSGDILTQGPTFLTQTDFWVMVFDAEAECVVMTTPHHEKGREKCSEYYPRLGKDQLFMQFFSSGNATVNVTCLEQKELDHGIIQRRFKLTRTVNGKTEEREIVHFQTPGWKDHGTFDIESMNYLLALTRPYRGKQVLHCSAGVGRTGTYKACETLETLIEEIAENQAPYTIDLVQLVVYLRTLRIWAVQTEDQFEMVEAFANQHLAERNL